MARQKETQWNLAGLKEAINKSSDIKNEVKILFERATMENFGEGAAILKKDEACSLYKLRYHILEERGVYNESFVKLLKKLATADNCSHVAIRVLTIEGKSYMVFSDNNYEECFGII